MFQLQVESIRHLLELILEGNFVHSQLIGVVHRQFIDLSLEITHLRRLLFEVRLGNQHLLSVR